MKEISKATTNQTNTYYYSNTSARFGVIGEGVNHGFTADLKIIVDASLAAQELDLIFNNILKDYL